MRQGVFHVRILFLVQSLDRLRTSRESRISYADSSAEPTSNRHRQQGSIHRVHENLRKLVGTMIIAVNLLL